MDAAGFPGVFTMHGRFLALILSLAFLSCAASHSANRVPSSTGAMEYAIAKLRDKGLSENFLQVLQENYRESERAKVLDLNLLGFLKARPMQDERIPGWELERVQKFLRSNKKTFFEVERKFPVPKEVIASLLWVETKHGKDIGRYHVASAYLSLVEADYPPILDQTMELAKERSAAFTPEIKQRVIDRSQAKAAWAADELKALQEIHEKGYKDAVTLEGSFSGAFGMAQFLPSSYLTWAKGRKKQPNLFDAGDSIYSVANYLAVNGWKRKDKLSHEAALFHYNRDQNYVSRILKMSECLRKTGGKRKVASKMKSC